MNRSRLLAAVVLGAAVALVQPGSAQTLPSLLFERYVDALRVQTGIPGLSAAIIRSGRVEWDAGFGRQDVERNVAALPDTPYPVGGLTQSLAATLLSICADRGMLAINHPISEWVPAFPTPGATVRHVMAHASDEVPLGRFRYAPERYALLTSVAEDCASQRFAPQMASVLLDRLGMASSVPGGDLADPSSPVRAYFDEATLARYTDVLQRTAVRYRLQGGAPVRIDGAAPALNASTGLVTTVRDLARYLLAMEQGVLLRSDSLALAWTPAGFGGPIMPTGLGWFVQDTVGERLIWQFSREPEGTSSLVLRAPRRGLTLIMLANSDGLASGVNLEGGDVTASPFVRIFLRLFV